MFETAHSSGVFVHGSIPNGTCCRISQCGGHLGVGQKRKKFEELSCEMPDGECTLATPPDSRPASYKRKRRELPRSPGLLSPLSQRIGLTKSHFSLAKAASLYRASQALQQVTCRTSTLTTSFQCNQKLQSAFESTEAYQSTMDVPKRPDDRGWSLPQFDEETKSTDQLNVYGHAASSSTLKTHHRTNPQASREEATDMTSGTNRYSTAASSGFKLACPAPFDRVSGCISETSDSLQSVSEAGIEQARSTTISTPPRARLITIPPLSSSQATLRRRSGPKIRDRQIKDSPEDSSLDISPLISECSWLAEHDPFIDSPRRDDDFEIPYSSKQQDNSRQVLQNMPPAINHIIDKSSDSVTDSLNVPTKFTQHSLEQILEFLTLLRTIINESEHRPLSGSQSTGPLNISWVSWRHLRASREYLIEIYASSYNCAVPMPASSPWKIKYKQYDGPSNVKCVRASFVRLYRECNKRSYKSLSALLPDDRQDLISPIQALSTVDYVLDKMKTVIQTEAQRQFSNYQGLPQPIQRNIPSKVLAVLGEGGKETPPTLMTRASNLALAAKSQWSKRSGKQPSKLSRNLSRASTNSEYDPLISKKREVHKERYGILLEIEDELKCVQDKYRHMLRGLMLAAFQWLSFERIENMQNAVKEIVKLGDIDTPQ